MKIKKLKNNITVIIDKVPTMNSCGIGFFIKAGSAYENPSNRGISHIVEHMMFKGTKKRNAQEISEEFDSMGSAMNAFTSEEYTCYYANVLPDNLVAAAELFSDMLMNSEFDKNELERELLVILEEFKMRKNSPSNRAVSTFNSIFYENTKYGVDIIGTEDCIKNTTREMILSYVNKHYTNKNTVIVVSGKFDENEIISYLNDNFNLGDKGNYDGVAVSEFPEMTPKSVTHIDKDTHQSYIIMGTHVFGKNDDRKFALSILARILGGGMSSRLFKSIREEKGLAYSIGSYVDYKSDTGSFTIRTGVSNERVDEAYEAICQELDKLKEHGISKDEFIKAKNMAKAHLIFGYESTYGRILGEGEHALLSSRIYSIDEIIAKIEAVTFEEVENIVGLIADKDNYTSLIYTNK